MITAAANNDLLFAAIRSRVEANDNLSFAPLSPSVDKLSQLGGSSPIQDELSRELVVIKLTTAATIDNSSIVAATVDGATGKSSTTPSNNNSHYQCNSHGDEKILCNKKILIAESENNSENNSKSISTKKFIWKNFSKKSRN